MFSAIVMLAACLLMAVGVTAFRPPQRLDWGIAARHRRLSIVGAIPRPHPQHLSTPPSIIGHRWKSRIISLASSTSDEEDKELTPATIAEMIEVSFLQSCLQLSQGYIDVLKLFIVAVKVGYERGLPLNDLHKLVEECPVNSAGRDLMKEEKELRLEWMRVVYEMLNALNSGAPVDSGCQGNDSKTSDARISQVVEAMLSIRNDLQSEEGSTGGKTDATSALVKLTVEGALERSSSLSTLNESMTDPMERAFLTNDMRVALVTFRVLEEEKVCMEDGAGRASTKEGAPEEQVPRPPIPGT